MLDSGNHTCLFSAAEATSAWSVKSLSCHARFPTGSKSTTFALLATFSRALTFDFRTQIFGHVLAPLNPRLIISETVGFYALLAKELCVHNTPFQEALMQAYCRDEHVRAHTDLLWLTGGHPPLVLRYASGARICGIPTPYLCLPSCNNPLKRVKRGSGFIHADRFTILNTQCCKARYRMQVAPDEQLPEEREVAGVRYVLQEWPARIAYTLTREVKRNTAVVPP
jgi:hypothetical protein